MYALSQGCHRDAFTHGCFDTQKRFTVSFAQRWFYTEQLYAQVPEQTEVLLQRNGFTQGAFTLTWLQTADAHLMRKSSICICKTAISPQHLTIEVHFVGKGWPSTNPFGLRDSEVDIHLHLYICHFTPACINLYNRLFFWKIWKSISTCTHICRNTPAYIHSVGVSHKL